MKTQATHDLPARLESTRRRFDRWRQMRDGRSHIPETLWASAVKAVGKYGLNPRSVSKLAPRVVGLTGGRGPSPPQARFVLVAGATVANSSNWLLLRLLVPPNASWSWSTRVG